MTAWMVPAVAVGLLLALVFPSLAVALLVWERFWRWWFRVPAAFDSVDVLPATDDTRVVLARIRPRGRASTLPPVLLVHGLAMNRRAFSLDPVRSLAAHLADLGRDVWLLELRGASDDTALGTRAEHGFDAYAREDVPTALAHIRAHTGQDLVDWVGFSMGGMLAYAHLGALGGGGVRRLVTLGSPVQWSLYKKSYLHRAPPRARAALRFLRLTPYRWLLTVCAPLLSTRLPHRFTPGIRPDNYQGYWLRRMMANAFGSAPAAITQEFVGWINAGQWQSRDGSIDYLAGLARITLPVCVIAGSRDRLALPAATLEAAERIASHTRRTLTIGPESGASAHYDHLDLLFARRADTEVFPHVVAWLSDP